MTTSTVRHDLTQHRVQAKELLRSARSGDPEALRRVLAYFPADAPLRLANAQLVIARELGYDSWSKLKRQAENAPPLSPSTTFFRAIERGDVEEVRSMLDAAPDLAMVWRRTDYQGWESALHVAAAAGRLEVSKALVAAGAQVYAVNQSDYPPVFGAFYSGNRELVDYLLEASAATDSGQPPTYGCGIDIGVASRIGMLDRVQMHLARDPFAVFRRGCIGETVLHWPAHNGHVEVVEALLDAGAVIEADEIGLYGGKPLHWASEHAPACVDLLLKRGANPNSRNLMPGDFEGYTPLHMCASQREQCVEAAAMLLLAGCDPKALDARGETAREAAIRNGHERMAAFLASS